MPDMPAASLLVVSDSARFASNNTCNPMPIPRLAPALLRGEHQTTMGKGFSYQASWSMPQLSPVSYTSLSADDEINGEAKEKSQDESLVLGHVRRPSWALTVGKTHVWNLLLLNVRPRPLPCESGDQTWPRTRYGVPCAAAAHVKRVTRPLPASRYRARRLTENSTLVPGRQSAAPLSRDDNDQFFSFPLDNGPWRWICQWAHWVAPE